MGEKYQTVSAACLAHPFLGYETPVVVRFRVKHLLFLNLLHEIVPLVALAPPDDTALQFLFGYACPACQYLLRAEYDIL